MKNGSDETEPFFESLSIFLSRNVARVQHFVRDVAVGFAEVFVVQRFYYGVFVALAERVFLILSVEDFGARFGNVGYVTRLRVDYGLTAAVYATAGASHDLDKVVFALARLDRKSTRLNSSHSC